MYKPSKRALVLSLTAGLIASSMGTVPSVQAAQTYDSSNVGITDKVGDYIQKGTSADPVSDLTAGKVTKADIEASFKEAAKKKDEKKTESEAASTTSASPTDAKVYTQFQGRAVVASEGSVNIRKEANTDSEIIGSLDRGGICLVDEIGKEWTKIESGCCVGYIANEFLLYGDDAGEWSDNNGIDRYAKVSTATLKVRESKDESSDCVTLIPEGEEYYVYSNSGEWVEVLIDEDLRGFVRSEFVELRYENPRAVSVEEQEIADRKAKEEADQAWLSYLAEQEATQKAEGNTDDGDTSSFDAGQALKAEGNNDDENSAETPSEDNNNEETPAETPSEDNNNEDAPAETPSEDNSNEEAPAETPSEDNSNEEAPAETPAEEPETEAPAEEPTTEAAEPAAPAGQTGIDLANYACQFVGNPYVWGGTSLTDGADCSGFVLSVYAAFGISLPHDAELQANYGTEVNLNDLQPGDLLFYWNGYEIGHVTIYIGDGQVVHASNSAPYPDGGIKISPVNYRTPCKACRLLGQ